MSEFQPIRWHDDPSHFRRVSRREFLYVGDAADACKMNPAAAKVMWAKYEKEGYLNRDPELRL